MPNFKIKNVKFFLKTIQAIILVGLCFSCRMPDNFGFYQPVLMETRVPDGPAEYKAGWHGGCRSALASKVFANSSVYQSGPGTYFGSGAFSHDSMYQTGWGQGWFSCVLTIAEFTGKPAMQHSPLD